MRLLASFYSCILLLILAQSLPTQVRAQNPVQLRPNQNLYALEDNSYLIYTINTGKIGLEKRFYLNGTSLKDSIVLPNGNFLVDSIYVFWNNDSEKLSLVITEFQDDSLSLLVYDVNPNNMQSSYLGSYKAVAGDRQVNLYKHRNSETLIFFAEEYSSQLVNKVNLMIINAQNQLVPIPNTLTSIASYDISAIKFTYDQNINRFTTKIAAQILRTFPVDTTFQIQFTPGSENYPQGSPGHIVGFNTLDFDSIFVLRRNITNVNPPSIEWYGHMLNNQLNTIYAVDSSSIDSSFNNYIDPKSVVFTKKGFTKINFFFDMTYPPGKQKFIAVEHFDFKFNKLCSEIYDGNDPNLHFYGPAIRNNKVFLYRELEGPTGYVHSYTLLENCLEVAEINEIETSIRYKLYPNPSTGNFHISTDRNIQGEHYEVYSIAGTKVASRRFVNAVENTFQLHEKPGIYFLHFQNQSVKLILH